MNYNTLMFFVIIFGLSSVKLSAQTKDLKTNITISTTIKDVKPLLSNSLLIRDEKPLKIANRHSDLINQIVNSKIKCTLDLFTIVKDKADC
ncbi:hypothetical protein J2Z57_001362 [Formosa algae]|uniref:Uncharacterized protein n=1 Tax=Formosa algae TaxID=225843 RepID=A0A9X0YIH5_9FLAO|nr:hypothetical protein [Formosa algae]MDQ0334929.1 hypothetical protein [Formosa algae]